MDLFTKWEIPKADVYDFSHLAACDYSLNDDMNMALATIESHRLKPQ